MEGIIPLDKLAERRDRRDRCLAKWDIEFKFILCTSLGNLRLSFIFFARLAGVKRNIPEWQNFLVFCLCRRQLCTYNRLCMQCFLTLYMYGKDTFTSLLSTFIHFLCRGNRWCRICLRRLFKKKVIVYILYTVGYNKRSQQTPCSYLMFSTGHEQLIFLIKSHTFFGLITYLPYCTLNFCTIVCTRSDHGNS